MKSSRPMTGTGTSPEAVLDRRRGDGIAGSCSRYSKSIHAVLRTTGRLRYFAGRLRRHERVPYWHAGHRPDRLHRFRWTLLFGSGNERVRLVERRTTAARRHHPANVQHADPGTVLGVWVYGSL